NELLGREYGDRLLREIGECIGKIAAEKKGIACRCDGDMFYLYIPHEKQCELLLDRLIADLAAQMESPPVTVRLGVYQDVDHSLAPEINFDRALRAASTLQGTHVSAYSFYDVKLQERELYDERLIGEIDVALQEKQFQVYYQAKYDIQNDRPVLCGAEALVRWVHPELNMISPGVFIPLFENNGLIYKLDDYIWREVAAQVRKWKSLYGAAVPPVSVNISRVDVYEPNLEEELVTIARENELRPDEWHLEITESAYTDNTDEIIKVVSNLRDRGFRIEMDDFGSGYSSLNMLAAMPIDILKLDMRFVRNICTNPKDYRMVKLMIDIAQSMGLRTVAEGVETEEQYLLLREAGCDIVQGYYFSKPCRPEEFEELIKKHTEEGSAKC
ncbi:MAG: EAL domain-containing protein, partial [Oscillibacter sp.]|nr:EAL domain-containing protein [Oscillibacter sp.]